MLPMQNAARQVWPVDPARWGQQCDSWVGEILIPPHPAPACDYLVAVRLPDGRLVRYDVEALWSFPREWQPMPTPILDFQI